MKRWHLHEHLLDIRDWWRDTHPDEWEYPEEQLRFIAYERWLNDRDLLTIEDSYEWRYSLHVNNPEKSPAPGRPTHESGYTHVKIERSEEVSRDAT